MSETNASRAGDTVLPPRLSGTQKSQTFSTSNASTSKGLFTETAFTGAPAGTAPKGKVYITFTVVGADVYAVLGATAPTVTTLTGSPWQIGTRGIWVDPTVDLYVGFITASGTGTISWYVSSPEYDSPVGIGA